MVRLFTENKTTNTKARGELPVNTNGGGLSCCHPGMYGIYPIIEAVRWVRGEAGARQVAGMEIPLQWRCFVEPGDPSDWF